MEFGYSVEARDVYSHRVANQKSRRRRVNLESSTDLLNLKIKYKTKEPV